MRLEVDLGGWAGRSGADLGAEFGLRFRERFLGLPRLLVEPQRTIEFCDRLLTAEGTAAPSMAEILLEAIVAVETAVAARMHRLDNVDYATFAGGTRQTELRWSSLAPTLSKLCAAAAIAGVNEILGSARSAEPFDEQFRALERIAISRRLTTTVSVIREAAKARGIPVAYVGGSYLRLGQGKYQSYFRGSITGKTSHSASQLSVDKRLTIKTLRLQRLPVPKQVQVTSAEAATKAARELGLPVAIKPTTGHGGAGVSIVRELAQVARSFKIAAKAGDGVLVEEFIPGKLYRLLVIGDKVVAALRVDLPEVTGDGVRSIAELVAELNRDPFRDGFRMVPIELDYALARHLKKSGATFETVLEAGSTLVLRNVANVSQGGFAVDVTQDVHRDNAEVAIRAARVIGLDVAGIDLMTPDIARSYRKTGGAIIEVNGRPGLGMHHWPRHGTQRDVSGPVIDLMYPQGSRAAIDTAFVVGDEGTAVIARDLDALLRDMGRTCGLSIRSKAFVNGERRDFKGRTSGGAIRMIAREPMVDCMVATAAPAGIVARGLQVSKAGVAAVTAPSDDTNLETYASAIDVLVAASPSRLVVGAENPMAARIVERLGPERVTLVGRGGLTASLRAHLSKGGHAVLARWIAGRRHIELHEPGGMAASLPTTGAPQVARGPASDHDSAVNSTGARSQRIEPRLFAVALAAALDHPIDRIAEALRRAPLSIR